MHIFEALMKDHQEVKDLLEELIALEDDDFESRTTLVEEIRDGLVPHSRAEEAILYNSLRALDKGTDKIMHSYREHLEAEALLRALQVADKTNLGWKMVAKKLKAALAHHIHEEETKTFEIARTTFSDADLRKLGKLFIQFKPKYQEEGFMENTREMVANLLPPEVSSALRNLKAS